MESRNAVFVQLGVSERLEPCKLGLRQTILGRIKALHDQRLVYVVKGISTAASERVFGHSDAAFAQVADKLFVGEDWEAVLLLSSV